MEESKALKHHFWNITFGQAMVVITILFSIVVYLLNSRVADNATRLRQEVLDRTQLTSELTTKMDHIYWYKEQGINFKDARKYNIEPPKEDKK